MSYRFDDDPHGDLSLTLQKQKPSKKQAMQSYQQVNAKRNRSKDRDSLMYSNRGASHPYKQNAMASFGRQKSTESHSAMKQMALGAKQVSKLETNLMQSQSQQSISKSKQQASQSKLRKNSTEKTGIQKHPLTSNHGERVHFQIEQFVYETQWDVLAGPQAGEEFTSKKQVMLLFDDQSMDDDEDEDGPSEVCKSDLLLQSIDPLFHTTSLFSQSSSSPVKEEPLSADASNLMSQTYKTKQNSMFESPVKKKRVLSSSYKSAKATVNKAISSPAQRKKQQDTEVKSGSRSPTKQSKPFNRSAVMTSIGKTKEMSISSQNTGARFRKNLNVRPSSKYQSNSFKLKSDQPQYSGYSSSQATDGMVVNKADFYSTQSKQKVPKTAMIAKRQLYGGGVNNQTLTHQRRQHFLQQQQMQIMQTMQQQTIDQQQYQQSQNYNPHQQQMVSSYTDQSYLNTQKQIKQKEQLMHQQLIQDTNKRFSQQVGGVQKNNFMMISQDSTEDLGILDQQVQSVNIMIPNSSQSQHDVKKQKSFKHNNRKLMSSSKQRSRLQSNALPISPTNYEVKNSDIQDKFSIHNKMYSNMKQQPKRKRLQSGKIRSDKKQQLQVQQQPAKAQNVVDNNEEPFKMTEQDMILFKQIKMLVNTHKNQSGSTEWSQQLQFS